MRAVNLLPPEDRRGGPGRSGAGAYILLAALAALVVAATAYTLAGNAIKDRTAELSRVEAGAARAEQEAAALKPYRDFAQLSQTRVATVASLAASRFDWERVMRELSRALPEDVWLTSLVGTVAPGVTMEGGSAGNTSSLRSAMQSPAVEIVGCTETQAAVSRVMARLRLINGVTRVALASSEKSESASGGAPASGGASSTDCRNGDSRFPQFQLVVFFRGAPAPSGGAATTATTSNGGSQ